MTHLPLPGPVDPNTTLPRLSNYALIGHVALSVFSAVAFATFLVPPMPTWLNTAVNQKIMAIGYAYGGQSTVVLGAIAGFSFLASRIGTSTTWRVFIVTFVLSLLAELAGTSTGLPFGAYSYSGLLGYKIAGLVPFNIPTSWFYMLVATLAMCGRFLPATSDSISKWWWALVAGVILTAWDVSMDPAMVRTSHWMWHTPDLTNASPFTRMLASPIFFGMPLTNWLGWLLTGILVARAMLAIVPPSTWAERVAPSSFPLVLYAANGLLPLAICFAQDMALAGVLGTLAMGIPLYAAARARRTSVAVGRENIGVVAIAGD